MASIRVAIDNCYGYSSDLKTLNAFADKLRAAGHTVTTHGVGPNKIQQTMLKSSNECDVMIQIGGGKCLGTLVDFYTGLGSYYHAKAGGFAYYKCYSPTWKAVRAHDDHFSSESSLAPYKGKTLPEIYKIMREKKKMCFGYGDTGEACATTFLQSYNGGSVNDTSGTTTPAGRSLTDIIKEICSDWNKLGVEGTLTGDTLNIKRSNPSTANPLGENRIINNSVSFTDYDVSTPNEYKKFKDTYLQARFEKIPLTTEEVDDTWEQQVLLMHQRGHEHSIDLKCLADPRFVAGKWVYLSLPRYGMEKRPYYISKTNYNEERTMQVTLDPGPPEMYVEVTATVDETSTEEETTEEEAEET